MILMTAIGKNIDIPLIHLFILCFLTVGTQSIIEKNYFSMDLLDVHVGIVLLADLAGFLFIFLTYVTIYLFLKSRLKSR